MSTNALASTGVISRPKSRLTRVLIVLVVLTIAAAIILVPMMSTRITAEDSPSKIITISCLEDPSGKGWYSLSILGHFDDMETHELGCDLNIMTTMWELWRLKTKEKLMEKYGFTEQGAELVTQSMSRAFIFKP